MNMYKEDEQIIINFCKERNLSPASAKGYLTGIGAYTQYQQKSLVDLIQEAEKEEKEGIAWKHTKLRERLINYRIHLLEKGYLANTVKGYLSRVQTMYVEGFDIDIGRLPKISQKSIKKPMPISFSDLPDIDIITEALKISTPVMRTAIIFMTSSGCAKRETLNLTVQDFLEATKEYHNTNDIYKALTILREKDDVVPTWRLKRQKTNKFYTTFSSSESTSEIVYYLLGEERELKLNSQLFKITETHFSNSFIKINNQLGLGKAGSYNRFRSHMLRKYHASQLYNDGMSMDEIDELQGRGKDPTRTSYFLEDPVHLREKYIQHMNAITINLDVNNLDIKSPEFVKLETENREKDEKIENYEKLIGDIDERLQSLEKRSSVEVRSYDDLWK